MPVVLRNCAPAEKGKKIRSHEYLPTSLSVGQVNQELGGLNAVSLVLRGFDLSTKIVGKFITEK